MKLTFERAVAGLSVLVATGSLVFTIYNSKQQRGATEQLVRNVAREFALVYQATSREADSSGQARPTARPVASKATRRARGGPVASPRPASSPGVQQPVVSLVSDSAELELRTRVFIERLAKQQKPRL